MKIYIYLNLISSISFIIYGFSCLYSKKMTSEFIRFEILPYKNFAGIAQIISSLLILAGTLNIYNTNLNTIFISLGAFILTIQMLVVIIVRIIKKDNLYVTIPGILYLILNSLIFLNYLSKVIFIT